MASRMAFNLILKSIPETEHTLMPSGVAYHM